MGQINSLVINDGTANRTFTFASETTDKAGNNTLVYEDRSGGLPLGFPTITITHRPAASVDTSASSVGIDITYPVVIAATSTTAAQKSHELRHKNGRNYLPNRSVVAERTILWNLVKNTYAHASVQALIVNAEAVYN